MKETLGCKNKDIMLCITSKKCWNVGTDTDRVSVRIL